MRSILGSFFQNQASTSGSLLSNTIPNPKDEMKAITTRSGATLAGPSVPPPSPSKEVKNRRQKQIRLESCMALANPGASINLMPLSVWKTLSLPELSTTRMTLELATRTIAVPEGIAEDVFVRKSFLRTAHALVDVHGEKLTLRVGDEELIFNVESASKHSQKHSDNSIHKIDILDTTCEHHVHEIDAFLSLDDSIPPGIHDDTYDSEGDIIFLESLLNDDPTPDLPPTPHPVCLINDAEKIKSSIDDPLDLLLNDLPSHLE
ncbi:hypothetical protein Tco_1367008 [Tanacetum coccineum]